jgi:hypothetical protein
MKSKWVALAIFTGAWALPVQAEMVRGQDPGTVVRALQGAGYTAKLSADKGGDPMITSSVSGTTFQVYFYNCTQNKDCATIQFHSGYDLKTSPSLEKINEWNRSKRFGRAFLDKENDPILEMDIDVDDGGISSALFSDNLEFWASVLADFERHIGYRN